jgi:hypothetical protein
MSDPITAPPPYTYDDPRIVYDQKCFFYDGGFDEICLGFEPIIPEEPLKRRTGSGGIGIGYRKQPRTNYDWLDIKIKACLTKVNDKKFHENEDLCGNVSFTGQLLPHKLNVEKYKAGTLERDIAVKNIHYGQSIYSFDMDGFKVNKTNPIVIKKIKVKDGPSISGLQSNENPDNNKVNEILKVSSITVNRKKK